MHVVIIGSGHAGITAAITLRQNSEDINISMITDDKYPHYPRPFIYKIILGKKPEDILRYPKAWYNKKNIDLFLNTHVNRIDRKSKELTTNTNEKISYDKLLITTGSKPFIPPIPGILEGPLYCLRNIEDAIAIRNRAKDCSTATILGGGLLSVELAKTLSDIGVQPTIIDRSSYPLRKQLDLEGGKFFKKMLDKMFNINFLFNANSQTISRENELISIDIQNDSGNKTLNCEFLLNATGIQNDNSLAQNAGIKIGKYAILVDPFMQTNIKDIYAAGDAVSIETFIGSKFGIIPTAIDQAKIATINILGNEVPYTGTVPWTTLKVAGIDLTSIGDVVVDSGVNEEGIISDYQNGIYRKLFFRENNLQGAILIGTKKSVHKLKTLTIRHAPYDEVSS
ncbi:MAG: NAD(P)/FAD-dependent oxidoreductase, partial [Candidatus Hodarchaeales archaeon]